MDHAGTPLDALPAAAVLAEAVCDERGQVLLPAGAHLSESMVDGLRRRGVQTVVLAQLQAPQSLPPMDLRTRQAQVDARMKRLFRHSLRTGQVNPLLHMVSRYRMKDPP